MKQNMQDAFQKRQAEAEEDSPAGGVVAVHAAAHGDEARGLRVLRLIEHLASASQPLTLSQLAARMQVPKASMMRLLDTLEQHGYVLRTPVGRGYVPGAASTNLALATLRNNALIRVSRSILGSLVAATGETCNLAIPEGNAIVYVDRVETQEPLRLHLVLGTRAPMHCTASGKLFLAHMTLLERRELLAMLTLQARTPKSITDPVLLEREIVRIARLGIGIDDEEFVHGMVAVAVPICAADGRIVAAVACHAPVARKSVEQLLQHVPQLKEAAVKLRPLLLAESS
ncbi:MAG: IclR family transcriptional regulator [Janthinobacterium svalbardensis]